VPQPPYVASLLKIAFFDQGVVLGLTWKIPGVLMTENLAETLQSRTENKDTHFLESPSLLYISSICWVPGTWQHAMSRVRLGWTDGKLGLAMSKDSNTLLSLQPLVQTCSHKALGSIPLGAQAHQYQVSD
jgi:hypothetical protein